MKNTTIYHEPFHLGGGFLDPRFREDDRENNVTANVNGPIPYTLVIPDLPCPPELLVIGGIGNLYNKYLDPQSS